MPRKQKKYHYIYKTTCKITGKFYIGMHSSNELEDGYLGSGKILGYSRRKYGDENHTREILEICDSREQLRSREKEIVNEELLKDPLNINLKYGGEGGWENINGSLTFEQRSTIGKISNRAWQEKFKEEKIRKDIVSKISTTLKNGYLSGRKPDGFCRGDIQQEMVIRSQTEKARKKRKESMKKNDHQKGEKNSQFGTRWAWINKNGLTKKIKLELLPTFVNDEWKRGIK